MPPKKGKKAKKLVTGNPLENAVGESLLSKIGMETVADDDST